MQYRLISMRHTFLKQVGLGILAALLALSTPGFSLAKVDPNSVSDAIRKAQIHLYELQKDDQYWAGEIHINPRETAYYIITVQYMGLDSEKARVQRSARWLLDHQSFDGSWGFFDEGGEGDVSITAICALALELAGVPEDSQELIEAQEFVSMHGGLNAIDPFAKTFYALFGKVPWDDESINPLPIEMLLAPKDSENSIYSLSAWIREAAVPTMVLQVLNDPNPTPAQLAGLREAEDWVVTHQLEDGVWYTELPTTLSMIALYELDFDTHYPRIMKALDWLHSKQDPDGYQRRFELSVWDTALATMALRESGISPTAQTLVNASEWLIDAQTKAGGEQWSNTPSGGWSYNQYNIIYPDNDDTALALMALQSTMMRSFTMEYEKRAAIEMGKRWLLYMQNDDGGWATFSRNQSERHYGAAPSGFDDPSVPDITGHVLSALGRLGHGREAPTIQRAIEFLKKDQTREGAWYGRWGLCYIYGTSAVLMGLADVGEDMNEPYVKKAVSWLESHQNTDGGWGERLAAWDPQGFTATEFADSTVEQTAWAVMALLSAGESPDSPAVEKGIVYILERQQWDGSWATEEYTVLGLNPYRNPLYPVYWPLMALGMFAQAKEISLVYPTTGESLPSLHFPTSWETYETAYEDITLSPNLLSEIGGRAEFEMNVGGIVELSSEDSLASKAKGADVNLQIRNVGTDVAKDLTLTISSSLSISPSVSTWTVLKPGEEVSLDLIIDEQSLTEFKGALTAEVQMEWTDSVGKPRSEMSPVTIDIGVPSESENSLMHTIVFVGAVCAFGFALAFIWTRKVMRPALVRYSFDALRRNKLRTGLTLLGMIVGVGAISGTLSLGLSFQDRLAHDFRSFGTGRILVLPYEMQIQVGPPIQPVGEHPLAKFDDEDVTAIEALPNVEAISPVIHAEDTVEFQGKETNLYIELVDPNTFGRTTPLELESGRFIAEGDAYHLNLGYAVANEAFDEKVTSGAEMVIGGKTFQVVGIFKNVGGLRGRLQTLVSPDILMVAPLSVASEFTTQSYYDAIEVRVSDDDLIAETSEDILNALAPRHGGEQYSTLYTEKLQDKVAGLLEQFNIIIITIGMFSLLVSGIGIMNTILVSVTERTKEIGVLKSMGAKDRTILGIFLMEAAALGLTGGIMGCVMGGLVVLGIQYVANLYASLNTVLLFVFSLAVALVVAIASATYPARQASKLDPTVALRHE